MVESQSRHGRDPKGAARAHLVEATIEGGEAGVCLGGDLAEVDIGVVPEPDHTVERRLRHGRGLTSERHSPVGFTPLSTA